jgi:disulfide bond formation protein DsbB
MSEWQQLLQHLKQPEYVHVLLNPLPVYATAMGVLALAVALLMRNRHAQIFALIVVFVGCASAWFVVRSGQLGYDRVYAMSDNDAQKWLDEHMRRAEKFVWAFYLTALVAVAAIAAPFKWKKSALPLTLSTLVLALASLGLAGWISHSGGQVRHSEFRNGPPPNTE